MTATTTVRIRLLLNSSDWTMITGRRKPGPDPAGSGKEAHQICPRRTTTLHVAANETAKPERSCPSQDPRCLRCIRYSMPPPHRASDVASQNPRRRAHRVHFGRASCAWTAVRPHQKQGRESRWRFSWLEYNRGYTDAQPIHWGADARSEARRPHVRRRRRTAG